MSKVIKAELGITRSSDGFYYIRIGCDTSHTQFCELKLNGAEFAEAVTGLHTSGVHATVNNLDRVGKQRIRESREVVAPTMGYSKEPYVQWLLENRQEEGWTIDAYLGSQSSMKHHVEGGCLLRYSVYKFIDVGEDDAITD